ncbi:3H domain-containing protein [Gottschalkia acidurici 9a]|uniref:3H domain-containing protein n=2 Tax=Clostridium acidurici TaxID=1556 RepID=K0AV14_GOTA9|nr:3H domain-containing protein [Gottschalkia acidurici 9a]
MIVMATEERRREISNILISTDKPIKGTELASRFDVSRQVIVQDIALLRAEGFDVIATPQGYIVPKYNNNKILKTIVSKHFSIDEVEDELVTMVDYGAKIVDVIVEHPIYGEMRGILDIGYKDEVNEFLKEVKNGNAEFLSTLTDGIHIHTIEVPNEESFAKLKKYY